MFLKSEEETAARNLTTITTPTTTSSSDDQQSNNSQGFFQRNIGICWLLQCFLSIQVYISFVFFLLFLLEFDFLNCDTQKLCNFSLAFLTFVLFSAIVFLVSSIVSINLKMFLYGIFICFFVSRFQVFQCLICT